MSNLLTSSTRVLNPIERVSEVFFGLIMVLTFTGSLSVAEAGRDDVRAMLIGALGCNLAWGIIDAVLYLMGRLAEKGRNIAALRAVREAGDPSVAQRLVAEGLPPVVAGVLQPAQLEAVRLRLIALPEPPARATLREGRLARRRGLVPAGVPVPRSRWRFRSWSCAARPPPCGSPTSSPSCCSS